MRQCSSMHEAGHGLYEQGLPKDAVVEEVAGVRPADRRLDLAEASRVCGRTSWGGRREFWS